MILNVRSIYDGTRLAFDLDGDRCTIDKDGDLTITIYNCKTGEITTEISMEDLKEIIKIHENRTEIKK